jgi:hypothetical protein
MGSLAWLRYLSHTQVIESSNLSPSIKFSSGTCYHENIKKLNLLLTLGASSKDPIPQII